ncbi:MAG: LysM peptidoglycan-binding domain-containing protein [Myxococcota bacterium]
MLLKGQLRRMARALPGFLNPRKITKHAVVGGALAAAALSFSPDTARAQSQQGEGSDYHVVDQGDTLWDLSGSYYGDSYEWPRVWSYNPHITNPHWIYPGDIVYLRPATEGEGEQMAGAGGQQQGSSDEASQQLDRGMYLPLAGFIVEERPEYVGRIVASPKEATMLAQGDTAWVGFGEDSYSEKEKDEIDEKDRKEFKDAGEVARGQKYAVVREAGEIKDEDGESIGHKYLVLGAIQITKVNEKYLDEAHVTQSWREMERGDLLVPYERQLKAVKATKADEDEPGARIVDTIQPGSVYAEHHYVFVNKGAADGVRPGNRMFIYQRDEGLHRPDMGEVPEEIPWQRVGQVMVIDVTEGYSTAIITNSKREVEVGDRLEMYGGY